MDRHALRRHNRESFWRSLRDCGWYAGQVAVMTLAWQDKQRPLYLALGIAAALIALATGWSALTWWREVRRDRAERGQPMAAPTAAPAPHPRGHPAR